MPGIVDDLTAAGVRCFGPTKKAAQLESNKSFSKAFFDRHGIPTAKWKAFTNAEEACAFINRYIFPEITAFIFLILFHSTLNSKVYSEFRIGI